MLCIQVFSGNTYKEQDLPVRHVFIRAFYTRYVKFHVTRWAATMPTLSLRVEIYGKRIGKKLNSDVIKNTEVSQFLKKDCLCWFVQGSTYWSSLWIIFALFWHILFSFTILLSNPEDELLVVTNTSFSASSFRYPLTPQDSILSGNKSWCAEFDDDTQYLEIDLKRNSHVTEIITQGAVDEDAWVETYTVSYGHSGDIWKRYKENGSLKVKMHDVIPLGFSHRWKWKKEKWKQRSFYSYIWFFILTLWEFPALQNIWKCNEQFSFHRFLSSQGFFWENKNCIARTSFDNQ